MSVPLISGRRVLMNRTILVTEPTGMLEQEIIRGLRNKGYCVKIAVHHSLEVQVLNYECPVVTLDYTDSESCRRALDGVQSVFLGFPTMFPRMDDLFLPFMNVAREKQVEHIVGLGSIGQGTDTPLMVVEKCIQNCGLDYTLLRPNLYMQHFKSVALPGIRDSHSIYLPAGDARISFVDVRDVAAAAQEALMDDGHVNRTYTITGGQSLDHYQIAEILSRVTGRKITYIPISHNELWGILKENGWDNTSVEIMVGLYEIARHGWSEDISSDLSLIIGRSPITFEQFAIDNQPEWLPEESS